MSSLVLIQKYVTFQMMLPFCNAHVMIVNVQVLFQDGQYAFCRDLNRT